MGRGGAGGWSFGYSSRFFSTGGVGSGEMVASGKSSSSNDLSSFSVGGIGVSLLEIREDSLCSGFAAITLAWVGGGTNEGGFARSGCNLLDPLST